MTIASNKKAFYNYFIEDKFEAGIELLGWEVKSARAAEVSLLDSFVFFAKGEAVLKNAHFAPYSKGSSAVEQIPRRDRRLLLRRSQIEKLHKAVQTKGVTCVVTRLYFNSRGLLKAEVAVARGKHTYDKKQVLKERDIKREAERQLKG